jgi:hypothetical protein
MMKMKERGVPGRTGRCVRCGANSTSTDGVLIRIQAQTIPIAIENKTSRTASSPVQNVRSNQEAVLPRELGPPASPGKSGNEDIAKCVAF